jgi:crotonobetainyl-CoA:carnitine CoA-transferase CaiB-like acyl-CoA transferase
MQVLDLGQVIAGNFCGAVLGYFGADVIKVGALLIEYAALHLIKQSW